MSHITSVFMQFIRCNGSPLINGARSMSMSSSRAKQSRHAHLQNQMPHQNSSTMQVTNYNTCTSVKKIRSCVLIKSSTQEHTTPLYLDSNKHCFTIFISIHVIIVYYIAAPHDAWFCSQQPLLSHTPGRI